MTEVQKFVVERSSVASDLAALPDVMDPEFPAAARRLVESLPDPEPTLRAILADSDADHRVRFAALYCILFRLRREERYGEYTELVREYERAFGSEPYFYTFKAVVARSYGATPASLRSAIEYAREATRRLPDVAGVLHQVADLIVEYSELIDEAPSPGMIEEAETDVDRAIALSYGQIGHYFETRAQILALRGDFASARAAIGDAIERESARSRDYMRRISEYNTTRMRIDLLAERSRWSRTQEAFKAELGRFRTQQIELLGLLAAVVAFVASASNIAGQAKGSEGLRLMIVMSGSVILVFSSFTFMTSKPAGRVVGAVVLGLVLLVLGLVFPSWLVSQS